EELVVEAAAAAVIAKQHSVLVEQVVAEDGDLALGQRDVPLPGEVHQRWAVAFFEVGQLGDGAAFRPLGHSLAGAGSILDEHVQVGPDTKVLIPVAAAVFQPDEANLAARGAAGKTGP